MYYINVFDTNIVNTLKEFNSIHPTIQYTIEKQKDNTLNYLDISIEQVDNNLVSGIYRKPTTTDLIIHNSLCHPMEHKNSPIRFLTNRMNTYPISANNKRKEEQQIETILVNNNYPQYVHKNNKTKQKHNKQHKKERKNGQRLHT
jgi:hypothetical protein